VDDAELAEKKLVYRSAFSTGTADRRDAARSACGSRILPRHRRAGVSVGENKTAAKKPGNDANADARKNPQNRNAMFPSYPPWFGRLLQEVADVAVEKIIKRERRWTLATR